ncbi:MAG TPA: hypothetical protein VGL42_12645 [Opitutaceae bacterium]|jgi:flagellar hook-associated protein 3 FlgL
MRITNNMVTNNLINEIQSLNTQQSQLQGQVASGLAVTQPSDNPSAFGQVIELESQNQQLDQYASNATQALQVANSTYEGLNSMSSIYDRATQLGSLATGTNGPNAQQAYATELGQLIQQAVQVANTQIGGTYVFAGTATNAAPFTATTDSNGNITAVNYVGNTNQASIPLSPGTSVAPGSTGATNQGLATMINNMISLQTAMVAGNVPNIDTANQAMISDEDTLTNAVAENGATQARIQSEQTQQTNETTELGTVIANDTSVNLPTTEVNLNQAELAYQAALQTAASVMHLSILNYINLS